MRLLPRRGWVARVLGYRDECPERKRQRADDLEAAKVAGESVVRIDAMADRIIEDQRRRTDTEVRKLGVATDTLTDTYLNLNGRTIREVAQKAREDLARREAAEA